MDDADSGAGQDKARGAPEPVPRTGTADSAPNTPSEQAPWAYTGHSERGRALEITGHITYLGGTAGERLRGELSTVVLDLLRWAATARNTAEESSEHQGDTAA